MTTYRALKKHLVPVFNGTAEVQKGELVNFASDPGEGWEAVGEVKSSGSNKREQSGTVARGGRRDGDDQGGV
jgi:hypothetical protein